MGLVATGATIGMPINLKSPSDHAPAMVTLAPKPRVSDGPPPIPGWAPAAGVRRVFGRADRRH
eukprot:5863431-Pyramimonas_sp.AAC.2